MSASTPAPRRRGSQTGRDAEAEGPRASFSQLMPFLLAHRGVLSIVVVLSIVAAAATLAQPLLVGQVITAVERGESFALLAGVLVALVVASALLSGLQHFLLQRTGTTIVLDARRQLVARILRLPISAFDQRRTGDLVSRVGTDTTLLYAVMTQGLVDAVGGVLIFVGALIAMLFIDAILLALTVLIISVSLVTVVTLSRGIRRASAEQQRRVGELSSAVERAISSIRTIRAANATQRETESIESSARSAWKAGLRVARISALVVPVAGIALQLSLLVVLGVGGFRVATGAIEVASLIMFIIFLFLLISPLGQAFGAISSVNQALGALGRIQEVLDLPEEGATDDAAAVTPRSDDAQSDAAALSFDRVTFRYATASPTDDASPDDQSPEAPLAETESNRDVLRSVSFTVPVGSRTALVGPSGAGKSTVLSLIERFYEPTEGVIRMGADDIRSIDRETLRGRIGYVEQDAPVLAGTLRENLLLGTPDATDEQCAAVLRSVNLGEVLDRDERGLDAQVGEDGVMLSGGERQRLAIARALLAAHPILLLDESTSSLDGVNEQRMRDAIDAVAEDRTLIVIAHRLSTVVDSDQIIVLDRGEVVGVGTHSELVRSVPLYRDLAKHQLLV
ncbi:MAG: ABC transporter ATP-binding protein [Microcella sp.]|uniref:ABC transporter ATP-binding protein n=1 Tax=Microcella sp. TaxID=1913979 RepID=UPI0024CB4378|nr:ABC transporter ATP-binding protein [Microcella sp.]UYN82648.1 MAG: ABC transporter ATP-binding protein [Microcella sp.]